MNSFHSSSDNTLKISANAMPASYFPHSSVLSLHDGTTPHPTLNYYYNIGTPFFPPHPFGLSFLPLIIEKQKEYCQKTGNVLYYCHRETIEPKAAYPSFLLGGYVKCPPDERKEGDTMYVTYAELFQFCTFIVALVGVCYTIFKDKRK